MQYIRLSQGHISLPKGLMLIKKWMVPKCTCGESYLPIPAAAACGRKEERECKLVEDAGVGAEWGAASLPDIILHQHIIKIYPVCQILID